jgi:pyruvate,water dikinase
VIAQAGQTENRPLQDLTWTQNIATLHEALALIPRVMELRQRYFPRALLGLGGLWLLLALARRRDRFGTLVSGVETKTTETNRALDALAAQIRADAALRDIFVQIGVSELYPALAQSGAGQAFWESFEAFLACYGRRETALAIPQPAWKDARNELLAHSILGSPLLNGLFLKSLTEARALFQIREDTHFYATLPQPVL